jgi:hypothetical protein
VKASRVEREPGPLDHRPAEIVERLDVDPAARGCDPHLAPADRAVKRAVDPEVREVGPEHPESLRGEHEVVRVRKGSSNVVEGLERLVRGSPRARARRRPAAGEDPLGGKRGAMVGHAIADVHEPGPAGKRAALAHVPAYRARPLVPETHAPALRERVGAVAANLEREALARGSTGKISCGSPLETITGRKRSARRWSPGRTRTCPTAHAETSSAGARIEPTSAASDSP